jgi:hypothetical protein
MGFGSRGPSVQIQSPRRIKSLIPKHLGDRQKGATFALEVHWAERGRLFRRPLSCALVPSASQRMLLVEIPWFEDSHASLFPSVTLRSRIVVLFKCIRQGITVDATEISARKPGWRVHPHVEGDQGPRWSRWRETGTGSLGSERWEEFSIEASRFSDART